MRSRKQRLERRAERRRSPNWSSCGRRGLTARLFLPAGFTPFRHFTSSTSDILHDPSNNGTGGYRSARMGRTPCREASESVALQIRRGHSRPEIQVRGSRSTRIFPIRNYRLGAASDNPAYLAGRKRIYEGLRIAGLQGRCPPWVHRVILVVGRSLPVFPWKRTLSGSVAMSEKCHERESPPE